MILECLPTLATINLNCCKQTLIYKKHEVTTKQNIRHTQEKRKQNTTIESRQHKKREQENKEQRTTKAIRRQENGNNHIPIKNYFKCK